MSDGSMDDLPRTLRRERELRERTAREQQQKEQARSGHMGTSAWDLAGQSSASGPANYGRAEPFNPYDTPHGSSRSDAADAIVRRIKVPFFSLTAFFIKAVFAAVPALLILVAMLYGLGIILQAYFPWLIKMKILISFPG